MEILAAISIFSERVAGSWAFTDTIIENQGETAICRVDYQVRYDGFFLDSDWQDASYVGRINPKDRAAIADTGSNRFRVISAQHCEDNRRF